MDFTTFDLRIGTVTSATPAEDAVYLSVSLGASSVRVESRVTETYEAEALVGRQVVVVTNATGGPVVLAGVSPMQGAVLLQPERPVEDGTQVV